MENQASFHIRGLDPDLFSNLHALSDSELAARSVVRMRVSEKPAAPCRITLDDAEIGESVLLLSYDHQPADTPYRQQGPIFVREGGARFDAKNLVPLALQRRMLSLRGFDAAHLMVEADVIDGAEAAQVIARLFTNSEVAYIHAHYAKRGCFAARIDRA
ncbi:MAG: DUF1203 domain-containing protein [Hyphomonadaceae bacterium]|nr:DUF1203 domain-containing protein [Hyphomonadaceae bacterium]